jgi:hypothetical protein
VCSARRRCGRWISFFFFSFSLPTSLSLCSAFFPLPPLAWRLSPLPICFGLWRLFLRHAFLLARRDETRRGGGASGRVGVREGHRGVDETTGPARGGVGVGGCCSRLVLGALGERQGQASQAPVASHATAPSRSVAECRGGQGRSKPSPMPPRHARRGARGRPRRGFITVTALPPSSPRLSALSSGPGPPGFASEIRERGAAGNGHGHARPPPTPSRLAPVESCERVTVGRGSE